MFSKLTANSGVFRGLTAFSVAAAVYFRNPLLVYTAIFLVLSVFTTRGLIIGLAYALIWEGIVAGLLPGSQVVSVREYLSGIVVTLSPDALGESVVGAGGFLYAAIALALALLLGSMRLARYEVRGAE